MYKLFLLLLTCYSFSIAGQTKIQDIKTIKTEKHVNIPGTRLFIIHPPDFKIATAFTGLQKENAATLQVYDLVGGNYYTNAASFSKEAFEKKGATVFDYKEIKVNDFPAKCIFMQNNQNRKAISLVFGDTTFSTMIMALYQTSDDKTEQLIQNMINSIYYDKNFKIDPFATAIFKLDESKSIFKFSKFTSGMYMYSIGGKAKQSYKDEPFVTVSTMPKEPAMDAKSISDLLTASIEKYGLTEKKVKTSSDKTINGYNAYEVEIDGKMNGSPCAIYQLIVTAQDKALAIQGILNTDFENNLKEIKKLAHTIQFK